MEAEAPGVFGPQGAYAQAYSLFNCAMAAATVVGPILAGGVQDRYGAPTVAWVLGVWCASAAVPVVSISLSLYIYFHPTILIFGGY